MEFPNPLSGEAEERVVQRSADGVSRRLHAVMTYGVLNPRMSCLLILISCLCFYFFLNSVVCALVSPTAISTPIESA